MHDGNTDGDLDGGSEEGDNTLYYTTDANWNVTALVDAETGEVVERYMYDPYGKATVCEEDWTPREDNASAVANDVLYCGYRFDPESGLYHVRHRYYHPTLGRWTSRDGAVYRDGNDLYAYGHLAAAHMTDPSGQAAGPVDFEVAPLEVLEHVAHKSLGAMNRDKDETNDAYAAADRNFDLGVGAQVTVFKPIEKLCCCWWPGGKSAAGIILIQKMRYSWVVDELPPGVQEFIRKHEDEHRKEQVRIFGSPEIQGPIQKEVTDHQAPNGAAYLMRADNAKQCQQVCRDSLYAKLWTMTGQIDKAMQEQADKQDARDWPKLGKMLDKFRLENPEKWKALRKKIDEE